MAQSPFPGMDPYLEEPRLWESFHNRYIGALDEALSAQVRPDFYVEVSRKSKVERGSRLHDADLRA